MVAINGFITYFKNSSLKEQENIIHILLELMQHNLNEDLIKQKPKDNTQINCPHCKSNVIQANGKNKGVQRYRCKACGKNFSETIGTPLAWLKKKINGLIIYNACSRVIRYVNVPKKSALACRHRLIGVIKY